MTSTVPSDLNSLIHALDKKMSCLPPEQTKSYFQAMRQVPHLVIKESSPFSCFSSAMTIMFNWLRRESQNIGGGVVNFLVTELSAQCLSPAWDLRSEVFGEYRYHPINQTGEGALERKEMALLKTSFVNVLEEDCLWECQDICCTTYQQCTFAIVPRV